jgi:hypothetical protein
MEDLQEALEVPDLNEGGDLMPMGIDDEASITSDLPGEEELFGWDPSLDPSRPVDDEMGQIDVTAIESARSANDEELSNPESALQACPAIEQDLKSKEADEQMTLWYDDEALRDAHREPHLHYFQARVDDLVTKRKKEAKENENVAARAVKKHKSKDHRMPRSKDEEMITEEQSQVAEGKDVNPFYCRIGPLTVLSGTDSREFVSPDSWRTYSLGRGAGGCTVGFSSPECYLPYACLHGVDQFRHLHLIPKFEGGLMIGYHLKWADNRRCSGEFLSWTISLLFALVHAIGRHEKAERDIYVAGGTSAKLKYPDGSPAKFYPAELIHSIFDVLAHSWREGNRDVAYKLHMRLFSHELLSLGELRDPEHAFKHVRLEDLISKGLFHLLPELCIDGIDKRSGLYECLTWLRDVLFRNVESPQPITETEILIAADLAALYIRDMDNGKIPLYHFLWFLALRKHDISASDCFKEYVLAHYQGKISVGTSIATWTPIDNISIRRRSFEISEDGRRSRQSAGVRRVPCTVTASSGDSGSSGYPPYKLSSRKSVQGECAVSCRRCDEGEENQAQIFHHSRAC